MKSNCLQHNSNEKQPWAGPELDEVLKKLNPDTAGILRSMALLCLAQPTGRCSIQALHNEWFLPAQCIRGRLAEVNRIHKRHRDRPRLFSSDRQGRYFTMDPAVAHFFARIDN